MDTGTGVFFVTVIVVVPWDTEERPEKINGDCVDDEAGGVVKMIGTVLVSTCGCGCGCGVSELDCAG